MAVVTPIATPMRMVAMMVDSEQVEYVNKELYEETQLAMGCASLFRAEFRWEKDNGGLG